MRDLLRDRIDSSRVFFSICDSVVAEDEHAGYRAWSTHIVRQTELRVFHLALTALALRLLDALVDHPHPARPDGVAEGLQAAAGIDREVSRQCGSPFNGQAAALPLGTETEVLGVGDFGPREAIVELGEADVEARTRCML